MSLLAVLSLCIATAAGPAQPPAALLAKVKQASGGAAWDAITTTHSSEAIEYGGLKGTAERWEDVKTGRFAERYALGPLTGADGFDGKEAWSQNESKQVRLEQGEDAKEGAANDAYRSALGYFFPERWPAKLESAGEKSEGDRRFLVLCATPKAGRPFDIWIDAKTYLIDRMVEKSYIETRTTYFSDYREVQGVRIAFAIRSSNGAEKYDQRRTLQSIDFNATVANAQFAAPAPPPPDFSIAGGNSTTVPFQLLNNHIYVQVKLNGKGPVPMLLDTGGDHILTCESAKALGLKTEGALEGRGVGDASEDVGVASVDTVEIGAATIKKQFFGVMPLPGMAKVEGTEEAGIVGYEIFKRFVATIDYEKRQLTLTLPSAFKYSGKGTVVPFRFDKHVPQVDGEIDGIAGKFDIDTGSRSSLDLMGGFIEKHGLRAKYASKLEGTTGWGVGGPSRATVSRAKSFKLGRVAVPAPVIGLTLRKEGGFAEPQGYVSGNVGGGILKRFTLILDYGHQSIVFEPNANYPKPDTFDRAGMWMNVVDGAFEVMDVFAQSPAAQAGIKKGDVITEVEGQPASSLTLPALRERLKSDPPGTKVRLKLRSGSAEREVIVTLRDLV